jgi:hypothetical protein
MFGRVPFLYTKYLEGDDNLVATFGWGYFLTVDNSQLKRPWLFHLKRRRTPAQQAWPLMFTIYEAAENLRRPASYGPFKGHSTYIKMRFTTGKQSLLSLLSSYSRKVGNRLLIAFHREPIYNNEYLWFHQTRLLPTPTHWNFTVFLFIYLHVYHIVFISQAVIPGWNLFPCS